LIFAFSAHQLFWAAMARREFITDALAGRGVVRNRAWGMN
jgi:hypothetical protein